MMTAKHQLILIRLHIVKNNLLWRTKKSITLMKNQKIENFQNKNKQKKDVTIYNQNISIFKVLQPFFGLANSKKQTRE